MDIKTQINIASDFQTPIARSMYSNYMLSRYSIGFDEIFISKKSLEKIKEEIRTIFDFTEYELPFSAFQSTYVMQYKDDWCIAHDLFKNTKEVAVSIYTNDFETIAKVLEILRKHESFCEDMVVKQTALTIMNGRMAETSKIIEKKDLEDVSKKYYPFMETDILFEQFMKSDENILLLTGEPGIGKTKLIKLMLQYLQQHPELIDFDEIIDIDSDFMDNEIPVLYVKSEEVLSSDSFWSTLEHNNYSLCILDDFDNFLSPRSENPTSHNEEMKNKFISNWLSFTDGTIKNKTKFIITTNRVTSKIDPAILRRGRTFDVLHLRSLNKDEALDIWLSEELDKEDFDYLFSDSDKIVQSELGSEISKYKLFKNNKMSFDKKTNYLKESGISSLKDIKKSQKTKGKISIG